LQATDGIDVVVIDDVCTTGGSTATAILRARESGLHVVGALCLVDRKMGAKEYLEGTLKCPFDWIFTLEELTHRGRESVAPFAASRTGN
jgi:orotate phosphoribosyltransferase